MLRPADGSAKAAAELRCRSQCYFSQDGTKTTRKEMMGYEECYVGLNLTQLLVQWAAAAVKMEFVVVIVAADIAWSEEGIEGTIQVLQ
jgi:hypothetical protein